MLKGLVRSLVLVCALGSVLLHSHKQIEHKCIHAQLQKKHPAIQLEHSEEERKKYGHMHAGHFKFDNGLKSETQKNQFHASHLASIPDPNTAVDGWHQIRIYLDFTHANQFVSQNPSLQSKYQLAARLTQNVRNYFNGNLMVNYMNRMKFSGGKCYEKTIASFDRPIDLLVVISPENDAATEYFAAATSCYLSPRDGRPTIGAYILNFAFL